MKYDTVTFSCDEADCQVIFTTPSADGPIEPYLAVVDAGWHVEHPFLKKWCHYCPKHADAHRPEVKP